MEAMIVKPTHERVAAFAVVVQAGRTGDEERERGSVLVEPAFDEVSPTGELVKFVENHKRLAAAPRRARRQPAGQNVFAILQGIPGEV